MEVESWPLKQGWQVFKEPLLKGGKDIAGP